MIIASGTLTFGPDHLDDAIAAMTALSAATLAEDGCVTYAYWQSLTDPGEFRVFEEWMNQDAMDAHMGSAHMAEFMGKVVELGITGADIWKFDGATKSRLI